MAEPQLTPFVARSSIERSSSVDSVVEGRHAVALRT
jgi:hypothetical protein